MTSDPTRPADPAAPADARAPAAQPGAAPAAQSAGGAPAEAGPWYATPEAPAPAGSAAPSYIPAGIVARPAPTKSPGKTSLLTVALVAAGLIAAAGVGFAGGRVTAPQQTANARGQGLGNGAGFPNASGRTGNGGFGGAFASGSIAISGSIVAMGNGTITVQPAGGSGTVQIAVPSTTTYHSQAAASSTDIAIGTPVQVTVNGRQFRGGPDASGAPGGAANASPGASGAPGLNLTATDILVTGK